MLSPVITTIYLLQMKYGSYPHKKTFGIFIYAETP